MKRTPEQRVSDVKEVSRWRAKEIRLRLKTRMKRRDLCKKYGLCEVMLCDAIKGRRLPHRQSIQKVIQAFQAEGIK